MSAISPLAHASVPCGTSSAGVLNVGLLPGIPGSPYYSTITAGVATGFDPALSIQVAKLLGYSTVNFIGYSSFAAGLTALASGAIDILAASNEQLAFLPSGTLGIVTDIARLYVDGDPFGWLLNDTCCALAESIDAAITQLVDTGVYAQILQSVRLAGLVPAGTFLGYPETVAATYTGRLLEPFPFASSELGTIPAACAPAGPNFLVTLPQTNCIGAYLQANCIPTTTFTGATGQILG